MAHHRPQRPRRFRLSSPMSWRNAQAVRRQWGKQGFYRHLRRFQRFLLRQQCHQGKGVDHADA